MNLLLVDDEDYVIESIKKNVHWEDTGIHEIYTASSMKQAQVVLEMMPVHLIISDIVMPQGSGFDFMTWVRQEKYDIQVIFLTSYAEFDYARRAIALDSVDYLLKPIDFQKLTQSIQKAAKKAEASMKYESYKTQSQHWENNQPLLHQNFWKELLGGTIKEQNFWEEVQKRQLKYDDGFRFMMIWLHFHDIKDMEKEPWDEQMLNFIIGNVLNEMIGTLGIAVETVLCFEDGSYCVVFCGQAPSKLPNFAETGLMDTFIQWISEKIHMDVWCGVADWELPMQLVNSLRYLKRMRENSLSVLNRVLYVSDFQQPDCAVLNPNLKTWEALIEEENSESLIGSMLRYLNEMAETQIITRDLLKKFRMDVTQMIYTWLDKQEIKAHLLFLNADSEGLQKQALDSLEGAKRFAKHLVSKAVAYKNYVNKSDSVTEQIKQYIDRHYKEDIRRDELAEFVYLNTDYMSRIFKKEVGVSLSNYILQKRVDEAKLLLSESDLPINSVSLHVGYSNFSYFTKMFRENTGYSPLEYRRKYKKI